MGDIANVNWTQNIEIDSFVDFRIKVGCAAGCHRHDLIIERYYDVVDMDLGHECKWCFKFVDSDEKYGLVKRIQRGWKFLWNPSEMLCFGDAVNVDVRQMKKVLYCLKSLNESDEVEEQTVSLDAFKESKEGSALDLDGYEFYVGVGTDIKLIAARMDKYDQYEIGCYYLDPLYYIGRWRLRLGRVLDSFLYGGETYYLTLNEVWLTDEQVNLLVGRIGADLDEMAAGVDQ